MAPTWYASPVGSVRSPGIVILDGDGARSETRPNRLCKLPDLRQRTFNPFLCHSVQSRAGSRSASWLVDRRKVHRRLFNRAAMTIPDCCRVTQGALQRFSCSCRIAGCCVRAVPSRCVSKLVARTRDWSTGDGNKVARAACRGTMASRCTDRQGLATDNKITYDNLHS
jgi:hypothetical protein